MNVIKDELQEKINEANIFLEHIKNVSLQKNSVLESSILKSAYVLILYNIVESMTRLAFESVHDQLSLYTYKQLCPDIKNLYNKFYFKNNKHEVENASFDYTLLNDKKFPLLEEYTKKITLYSGNLDARELNEILGKYGIGSITCASKKNLLIIKNKRNKLAHGEERFKDGCRTYTIVELEIWKNSIDETIQQLIDSIGYYLKNKKYLAL